MADDQMIVVIGNLTADPELRFTPSGAAVANFTVAKTPRTFDKQSQQWKDGETLFFRCSVWREQAENVAESLTKGMRVILEGKLKSRSFEGKDGTRQTVQEIDVDDIGPSLKYATAKVTRKAKPGGGSYGGGGGFGGQQGGGGGFGGSGGGYPQGGPAGGSRQDAVWNAQGGTDTSGWGQQGGDDEPPF